ncbi:SDR family NAD(P)-dependent oxidoreductase [Pseudonocardia acaciae]|uniref:SDR family NAD(P)-dependent oxidoreductase n=1 Tax=Pseudonocardia acaciae TaxID=551276 RepID=UPI000568D4DC|nr:SDR family oxidoreductase [Pseudonocardia acaciae]
MTDRLMSGRVAFVTGASRGIGAATARLLARHGAAVGVNYYRGEEPAGRVVSAIRDAGGTAFALRADARDERQVADACDELSRRAGPVDTLVLNAVSGSAFVPTPLVAQDPSLTLDKTTDQLRMCLCPVRAVAPGMVERRFGSIIAIGSEVARTPVGGMGAVSVAKSAVAAAMRTLALELGPSGVRVNIVAPGMVLTELSEFIPDAEKAANARATALRRNATPDDVAGAVLLMASDYTGFVTGALVPVQGGLRIG